MKELEEFVVSEVTFNSNNKSTSAYQSMAEQGDCDNCCTDENVCMP